MIILHISIQSDPVHKYFIFTDTTTTPDDAVKLLIQRIDTFAVAHHGEFTFFRDGVKNPHTTRAFRVVTNKNFRIRLRGYQVSKSVVV